MFPGQAYRQATVNIKEGKEKSFEAFLSQYQESVNTGIGFRSKGEYRENFYTARLNEVLAFFIIGTVILAAGLINYGNILLTKIIVEKREFAVYESLGMTVGQLKKLLITEGLLQGGVLLLILIFCISDYLAGASGLVFSDGLLVYGLPLFSASFMDCRNDSGADVCSDSSSGTCGSEKRNDP